MVLKLKNQGWEVVEPQTQEKNETTKFSTAHTQPQNSLPQAQNPIL